MRGNKFKLDSQTPQDVFLGIIRRLQENDASLEVVDVGGSTPPKWPYNGYNCSSTDGEEPDVSTKLLPRIDDPIGSIFEAIKSNTSLKKLRVYADDALLVKLTKVLKYNISIRVLELSFCLEIKISTLNDLTEVLKTHPSIESLDIDLEGSRGEIKLAEVIKSNVTLRKLTLCFWHKCSDSFANEFMLAIKANTSLQSLKINFISSLYRGINILALIHLKECTNLKSFELEIYNISEKESKDLARVLEENIPVTKLHAQAWVRVGRKDVQKYKVALDFPVLAKAIRTNFSITDFGIWPNDRMKVIATRNQDPRMRVRFNITMAAAIIYRSCELSNSVFGIFKSQGLPMKDVLSRILFFVSPNFHASVVDVNTGKKKARYLSLFQSVDQLEISRIFRKLKLCMNERDSNNILCSLYDRITKAIELLKPVLQNAYKNHEPGLLSSTGKIFIDWIFNNLGSEASEFILLNCIDLDLTCFHSHAVRFFNDHGDQLRPRDIEVFIATMKILHIYKIANAMPYQLLDSLANVNVVAFLRGKISGIERQLSFMGAAPHHGPSLGYYLKLFSEDFPISKESNKTGHCTIA